MVEAVEFRQTVDLFKCLKTSALEDLATQVRVVQPSDGHMIRDTRRDTTPDDGLVDSERTVGMWKQTQSVGSGGQCRTRTCDLLRVKQAL